MGSSGASGTRTTRDRRRVLESGKKAGVEPNRTTSREISQMRHQLGDAGPVFPQPRCTARQFSASAPARRCVQSHAVGQQIFRRSRSENSAAIAPRGPEPEARSSEPVVLMAPERAGRHVDLAAETMAPTTRRRARHVCAVVLVPDEVRTAIASWLA
jgi:hypothetical protein